PKKRPACLRLFTENLTRIHYSHAQAHLHRIHCLSPQGSCTPDLNRPLVFVDCGGMEPRRNVRYRGIVSLIDRD
ncbi:unnamed protein product, partial [Mycena citricolor]